MVVDCMFGLWLCVLCQICQIHCYMEELFCQLAMCQKMLPFGKLLFLPFSKKMMESEVLMLCIILSGTKYSRVDPA
jgi:hypothetical protein